MAQGSKSRKSAPGGEPAAPESVTPETVAHEAVPHDAALHHEPVAPTEPAKAVIIDAVAEPLTEPVAPAKPAAEPPRVAGPVMTPKQPSMLPRMIGAGAIGAALMGAIGGAALTSGAVPLPDDGRLAGAQARIATLEKTLKELPKAAPAVDLAPLTTRLAAVEAKAGQAAAAPAPAANVDLTPLNERLAAGEASAQQGAQKLAALENTTQQGLARANDAAVQLSERLGQLDKMLTETRNTLDTRVKTLEASEGATLSRKLATALSVDALRGAYERNQPFADQLATAKPYLAEGDTAALAPLAATGSPSPAALNAAFASASRAMLNAAPKPDGSLADRAKGLLSGIVSIRRKGEAAGDTPQAQIGRVEAALAQNNREAALKAFEALPDPMKAAAADFGTLLRHDVAAAATIKRLAAQSVAALGGR